MNKLLINKSVLEIRKKQSKIYAESTIDDCLSLSAWIVHHHYHKDPLEKKSTISETEDFTAFNLIKSQLIFSASNMF